MMMVIMHRIDYQKSYKVLDFAEEGTYDLDNYREFYPQYQIAHNRYYDIVKRNWGLKP